jgi:hypothetical protein
LKDMAHRSTTYKIYWAQWKSLAVRNGILERHWESADGRSKIISPRSRVNDVLAELHVGPSGGHLGVNKTPGKVRQKYYWFRARNDVEKLCRQRDTCAASRGPPNQESRPKASLNVGAAFERTVIDVAGPFPRSDQGNQYI